MVDKIGRKYDKLFGIRLDSTSLSSLLTSVKYRIEANQKISIFTPNPEIVLASFTDQNLKETLNKADISLPDGIGIAQASTFLSLHAPKNKALRLIVCFFQGIGVGASTFINKKWLLKSLNVLPGRKVFLELIKEANKNKWRVFLLGGIGGVSQKAAQVLGRKYPKAKFDFADGPKLTKRGDLDTEVDILIHKTCIEKINKFKPHLLFVALGPTKQEKWIVKNLKQINVNGAMAVGGTFNYVAGVSKLPPRWMEGAGLEWLWRLLAEPWRLGRIINASIIFPWKVFWYKVSNHV